MALLGAQLCITLVMVSIIQKLSLHFSFAKWLLCSTGLIRFLHPTDSELRIIAGIPRMKPKKDTKHRNGYEDKSDTFHVPRNLDIQLESAKITPFDVIYLRYYSEYQWLVDFSLYALLVYILSEIYHSIFPIKDEINLSMMWCFLVILFAFKLLISLTVQYFQSEESIGERSTCIVTGLAYFLIAMIILIIPETTLETGLEKAYFSFNQSASTFLESQGLNSSGPASKIVIKFFIAVSCGVVGAIFTFPGLRMSRMHWDSLKYCEGRRLMQLLLNISFAMPFILVILWIKPITRDFLAGKGGNEALLTESAFNTMRLVLIGLTVLLRFALMPIYLQAYLNLAYQRLEEQKKEAGRITNVELQKKIASIFYYLCVVTLQYVAPIIMCLYLSLIFKTLGGYTWTGFLSTDSTNSQLQECSADLEPPTLNNVYSSPADENEESGILTTAENFQMSLQSLKAVFTTDVYRGLFGFATWWCCFVWFAATSLGMLYQSYFSKS